MQDQQVGPDIGDRLFPENPCKFGRKLSTRSPISGFSLFHLTDDFAGQGLYPVMLCKETFGLIAFNTRHGIGAAHHSDSC